MDPETLAMLNAMDAEYRATMQPFWEQMQRENDELAALLAELAPPPLPAWFD